RRTSRRTRACPCRTRGWPGGLLPGTRPGSKRETRLLEERLDVPQELGTRCAVDCAMVTREGELHARPHGRLAVDRHDSVLDRAHREDRRLRGIEHRDEPLDAEHPEVRDRER